MSSLAAPPDVLRWTPRYEQDHGDCAVSALSLACGVTYEMALAAALKTSPEVLSEGMSWDQIRTAAKLLGMAPKLLRRGKYALDESTGILHITQPAVKDSSHVVYLWEGRIIEPKADRRQLWLSAEQFLEHYKYKASSLMVFVDEEKDA